jgi:hypothetical protein
MSRQSEPADLRKENKHMGLLDAVIGKYFRDEKVGRSSFLREIAAIEATLSTPALRKRELDPS